MSSFASQRAREQVEHLVGYVAFPGMCLLVDPSGGVLIRSGELPGFEAEHFAGLVLTLASKDANPTSVDPELLKIARAPRDYYAILLALRSGYQLCAVAPSAIAANSVIGRLERARNKLLTMM